jgi:hypothetical protein
MSGNLSLTSLKDSNLSLSGYNINVTNLYDFVKQLNVNPFYTVSMSDVPC